MKFFQGNRILEYLWGTRLKRNLLQKPQKERNYNILTTYIHVSIQLKYIIFIIDFEALTCHDAFFIFHFLKSSYIVPSSHFHFAYFPSFLALQKKKKIENKLSSNDFGEAMKLDSVINFHPRIQPELLDHNQWLIALSISGILCPT